MMMIRNCILTLLLVFSTLSFAADNPADPTIEARLKILSTELRCLVCQNSTLADSDASLAQDLRNEIRKLMKEGKTDKEIVAYLVARYGDFVTFRPPVNASTALLWFGPFIMLLIGAITLVVVLKKRSAAFAAEEKSPE
ncbi:MAG: cytochrome C biogenesis protein CcmH [Methylophilaceae bacterium]|nr:MAG: cytochrome C biogenesis protein CcmH [Methylophilaceae bacterium]